MNKPDAREQAILDEMMFKLLRHENAELKARLASTRQAIIEECARVAEAYPDLWEEPNHGAKAIRKLASEEIAAGIRALAEKP